MKQEDWKSYIAIIASDGKRKYTEIEKKRVAKVKALKEVRLKKQTERAAKKAAKANKATS